MFESAEIGHKLSKSEYKREEPKLRQALLKAQYDLLDNGKFPVIILVNGVDGAGKGETVNLFNEWMDPRHIHTHAFGASTDAEVRHPEMWRFWQALPPKGRIGILFGSWYTDPILKRVMGHEKRAEFERRLDRIRHFERMLVAEGALVLKLWFHLSKPAQKKRFKELMSSKKTAWRVGPGDWERFKHYDEFVDVCEDALRESSTGEAPWHVIEGSDPEYRSLTAGKLLLDALTARLKGAAPKVSPPAPPPAPPIDKRNVLNSLDYTRTLSAKAYDKRLEKAQARLNQLTRDRKMRERSLVMVFEGMDAAGKGSTIRRVTRAMDARFYRVIPVAAPTDEERAQPYLWRFWRHIPGHGRPRHLRPLLVRARARRARRGLLLGGRLDARLPRDQRLRGAARRRRRDRGQVLDGGDAAGAAAPLQGAREDRLQALQDHRRGLAQPQEVAPVRARDLRHDRAHLDRGGAVEPRRRQRQAARARVGHREALRPHRVEALRRP